MKLHKWADIEKKRHTPKEIAESKAWARLEVLQMNLAALRKALGKNQMELAKLAAMSQSEVSRVENNTETAMLPTLRRIVEALGGELEVHAIFKDKDVKLTGI